MTTNFPAGTTTLVHTVRDAMRAEGIRVHVEPYARGVIVSILRHDTEGAVTISKAHAALRLTSIAPSHIHRQAPTVLKIVPTRVRKPKA